MDDFQSIIDALADVVFVHHPITGEIEYINKTCEEFYGYPAELLIEKGLKLIIADAEGFDFNKQMELLAMAAKGEVLSFEWKTQKASGEDFWVEVTLKRAIVNQEIKVVATVSDISSLKAANKALREREYLLESINKNITDGIYRTNAMGGFVYVNNAFVKMFGYESVAEMLATQPEKMYADPNYRKEISKQVLSGDAKFENHVVELKKKDGTLFWGLVGGNFTKISESNIVFDGVLKDITQDKKDSEELKLLNEELVERNFELDQLVYKTSHDLRSPLRSVLGLTNLMKAENPDVHTEFIDRIDDRIHKMDEFIQSMLNYSRASRLELKNEAINFPELVAACVSDMQYIDNFSDFRIIEEYEGDLISVKVDRLRLSIVFCNLISNAFKYRNTEIIDNYLIIKVRSTAKMLHIVFIDNGIGIDKKYLNKVFNMFFRATEKAEGSGLGMYIVKQAIEKLKGRVSIESELRVGTTLKIEIPVHK